MTLKHMGIRELRGDLSRLVSGEDIIAIERHGHLLGFYIPIRRTSEQERQVLLDRADEAFKRLREEGGMSEDDLATLLDPSQPDSSALEE